MTFTLSPLPTPEVLDTLRTGVSDALASGETSIDVDIDALDELDTKVIATLITLLRDVRTHGATIVLRASRPSLLAALQLTALDKLFTIEAPGAPLLPGGSGAVAAAAPPRLKRARRRMVAVLVGALVGIFVSRASAATETAPAEIVSNLIAQNADMQSYQAEVKVDVRLRSFPYVAQHLDGATYFKRPDNFEVVFESVPGYAKGFERVYSDIGDPTGWTRHFDISLAGRRTVGGRRDLVLRLIQKVRGMIDHEDVAIDPATWQIDQIDWHYYNGGVIAMSQEYQSVGGFTVLAKQHATIHIPFVHAAAEATYGDYRTNVAIDDNVFTREKR